MTSSGVPTMRGSDGLRVTEDKASRQDFIQGARAGGLLVGAVAAAAILQRVQGGGRGARRRRR